MFISEIMDYQKKSASIIELLVKVELCTGSSEVLNAVNENFDKVGENLGSSFTDFD